MHRGDRIPELFRNRLLRVCSFTNISLSSILVRLVVDIVINACLCIVLQFVPVRFQGFPSISILACSHRGLQGSISFSGRGFKKKKPVITVASVGLNLFLRDTDCNRQ